MVLVVLVVVLVALVVLKVLVLVQVLVVVLVVVIAVMVVVVAVAFLIASCSCPFMPVQAVLWPRAQRARASLLWAFLQSGGYLTLHHPGSRRI